MSATGSIVPVIPKSLSNKHPERWRRADVLAFLEANKEEYDLDDKHINVIRENEVSGLVFLTLTKEELATGYKLPLGPAAAIEILLKELIHILKQTVFQKVDIARPQPVSSPRLTYKSKSSSMITQQNQTCKKLDPLLGNELEGTIYQDVRGFDKLFENAEPRDIYRDVMKPDSFDDWLSYTKSTDVTAFERHAVQWFSIFYSNAPDAATTNRFWYPSGSIYMRDPRHGAKRKPDLILTQKLDDSSHGTATDVRSDSEWKHSWKDVLLIAEIKRNFREDLSKDTILQVSHYIRETFGAQPGRRFVHAFTVCGKYVRFWFFDRVGVSISESYDISAEDGQRFFLKALGSYMRMTASQLGFDERYKDECGNTRLGIRFSAHNDVMDPTYLQLGEKRLKLLKILNSSHAIITRGTLCWLAKEESGDCKCEYGNSCEICKEKMCVVKLSWCDTRLTPEAQHWELAKEKNVWGRLDILLAGETDIVCQGGSGAAEWGNNIRNCFNYTGAKLIVRDWMSQYSDEDSGHSTRKTGTPGKFENDTLPTIHSGTEDTYPPHSCVASTSQLTQQSRKRSSASQLKFEQASKKRRFAGAAVVEARSYRFMVIQQVGRSLSRKFQPIELAETLRDAIKCHRSLYEKAGILHCDISLNNIMRTRTPDSVDLKGYLIDLDYAHQFKPICPTELEEERTQSTCITGTAPFMALELLLEKPVCHTWRHDLESFFYVLIWLSTENPDTTLNAWVTSLTSKPNAKSKSADILLFFDKVLNAFHSRFECLKQLASEFRSILFKNSKMTSTPTGDDARKAMYDNVIQAINNCIVQLEQAEGVQQRDDQSTEDLTVIEGWEYVNKPRNTEVIANSSGERICDLG